MELDLQTGPRTQADGLSDGSLRTGRQNDLIVSDAHARYFEATARKQVFSVALAATTTGVAAGNIVGATAAASTQFGLWNPSGSNVNLSLVRFGMGVISGTPGAGPVFHGLILDSLPTISAVGTARCNYASTVAPNAKFVASAAGTAITGGSGPVTLCVADFSSTGTAQASVGELKAVEYLDGSIVLPPGTGWVPLWGAAGTSLLNAYSITWEEIPS